MLISVLKTAGLFSYYSSKPAKYLLPHCISKFPTNLNFQFRRKIENILLYPLLISVSCLLIFQCTIKYIYYTSSFYVNINKLQRKDLIFLLKNLYFTVIIYLQINKYNRKDLLECYMILKGKC